MSASTFLGLLNSSGSGRYELVAADRESVLAANVELALDSTSRRKGLLGRDSIPEDVALVIAPCESVHTFFMRFAIDVVFVSRGGRVVKVCRSVKPWRIAGAWGAFAVVEAATGFIDRKNVVRGDVVGVREVPHRRRATDVLLTPAARSLGDANISGTHHQDRRHLVTLADIIARQTPISWFQGVAIVQELCAAVLARGPADDPRVPELTDVAVTPAGGIELLAEGVAERAQVRRACLVLLALVPEDHLPVPLRLVTLGGLAPKPQFQSLKQLHAELEFFERPDRLENIRVVLERFQAESAPGGASVESETPVLPVSPATAIVPPPVSTLAARKPGNRRLGRGALWQIPLVLLATAGVAWVVWEWQRPEGQWLRVRTVEFARSVWDAARVAAQQILDALGVGK
jgi:uncharacterized membrane protein (UPF0127 family)